MELLIAGSIAVLGYAYTPGRAPRRAKHAPQLGPSNEYVEPGNDTRGLDRDYVTRAERRWLAARDPALTGVVTPHTKLTNAQLPFFTSAKKQNTNDAVKQTRLETFTGANGLATSATGTYRHKREVEAMFSPSYTAQQVTSSGSSGNSMYDRDDPRYANAPWQNNLLPAEQVRVGRGIGVGPDVPATDGFHPMYRVMLKNVGEYKKNNLPGGVNHGARAIAKGTERPRVVVNHNPGSLTIDQDRRPMMPSRAAVRAPAIEPQLAQDPGMRPKPMELDRFGNPSRSGTGVRSAKEARAAYERGDSADRNHTMPLLNVTGAAAGVGAFTHASVDTQRVASQQREAAGREGFLAGPIARQAPAGQLLPPTQRDMTPSAPVGGVGVIRSSGATRKADRAKVTLRDTQGSHGMITGVKAAVSGGAMDNVWRYKRLDREAKRAGRHVEHVPGPQRTNIMHGVDEMGQVAQRQRDTVQPAPLGLPAVSNKAYQEALGARGTPNNKLPTANPRLDLHLAADQLAGNPYAVCRA